jgi:hypothetical protein
LCLPIHRPCPYIGTWPYKDPSEWQGNRSRNLTGGTQTKRPLQRSLNIGSLVSGGSSDGWGFQGFGEWSLSNDPSPAKESVRYYAMTWNCLIQGHGALHASWLGLTCGASPSLENIAPCGRSYMKDLTSISAACATVTHGIDTLTKLTVITGRGLHVLNDVYGGSKSSC